MVPLGVVTLSLDLYRLRKNLVSFLPFVHISYLPSSLRYFPFKFRVSEKSFPLLSCFNIALLHLTLSVDYAVTVAARNASTSKANLFIYI